MDSRASGRSYSCHVRRTQQLVLAVAVLCVLTGCGGGEAGVKSQAFGPLSGRDVIEATKAAGTAAFAIRDRGAVADPGTDHGTSGYEEDNLDYDTSFDFTRNRALTRWQFPAELGGEAIDVEVRTLEGTSYVKDGSWLCPGCGLDGDEPLPSDKWITLRETDADVAFTFGSSELRGQLGWLALVEKAVEPEGTSRLRDGTEIEAYRTAVSAADVNAAVTEADPNNEYAPKYQGKAIVIAFKVDAQHRLRELVVEYHVDDRTRRLTATLKEFGEPVQIEVPPPEEIYEG